MGELSLCMIVRNEEAHLARCLESVRRAVDEIVIVDTGSTDRTREIAARYADRMADFVWTDDFSAARNASMEIATRDYILWLDADDVLDAKACEKLLALKEELDGSIDAVMMPYHYAYGEDGSVALSFDRERIVRRGAGFRFEGAVHEAMTVGGNVIRADIAIRHTGRHHAQSCRRNLAIYENRIAQGAEMTPRDRYYYARELKSAGRYAQAADAFDAFLSGGGWMENRIDAYVQRGECLRMTGRYGEAKASFLAAIGLAPRAEAMCAMGACLMEEKKTEDAAFWYRAALACRMPEGSAFVAPQAYGYIPLMQLCVLYDEMGEVYLASQMNEQALLLRPQDAAAQANRAYFRQALSAARDGKKAGTAMEKRGLEG